MASKEWYAVRVRPKSEARASSELEARGFEVFLPVSRVRRRWSDRVKTLEIPFFPGYLFCKLRPQERVRILSTPAVIQVLGIAGIPNPVSESEIEAIERLVGSRLTVTPWPYLHSGQHIRIERGPLAGLDGIVAKAEDGKSRVVVSVSLLQRSIATEIDRDWIDLQTGHEAEYSFVPAASEQPQAWA
jgi:transcription termination/antitermination protein NusG